MAYRNEKFWQWFDSYAAPRLSQAHPLVHRTDTFRKMFQHLDKVDGIVGIIETGSLEDPDKWVNNGCSTIMFDMYAQTRENDSWVHTVDVNPANIDLVKSVCSKRTMPVLGDSVEFLRNCASVRVMPLNLIYLDASHLDWTHPLAAQVHHYNELMAILPAMKPDTLLAIDDSPTATVDNFPMLEVTGKGALVAKYAEEVGAQMVFHGYQSGWVGLTNLVYRNPDTFEQLIMRARRHAEALELAQAASLYKAVLANTAPPWTGRIRVARGEACMFFARMATTVKKLGTALDWYRQALECDPYASEYRMNMIQQVLVPMGYLTMAQTESKKLITLFPNESLAWRCLGGIEHELGNEKEAIKAYDKGLALNPDDIQAKLDMCSIAIDACHYDKVKELAPQVFGTKYEGDAWFCLAMVAFRECEYETAIEYYDKALNKNCRDRGSVAWNKSTALHAIGRYKEGWEAHEYRKSAKHNPVLSLPLKRFTKPMWNNEPPPAIIHVHAEAGYGDNISLLRYLPILAERGYTVRYECQDNLFELAVRSFPTVEVVPRALDYPGAVGIKEFDHHIPIGSLPYAFKTDLDTVPWNGPYMIADSNKVEKYRRALSHYDGRKIGLVWSSGIRRSMGVWMVKYGANKSMTFKELTDYLDTSKHCYVSLQVGPERDENIAGSGVIDVLPAEDVTWDDTAALVANLDLVITVDTAVAHLAGAMGKPVWLMMHSQGSWHWMAEYPGSKWIDKSPWYPSVRIFRQKELGVWSDVLKRIALALHEEKVSLVA